LQLRAGTVGIASRFRAGWPRDRLSIFGQCARVLSPGLEGQDVATELSCPSGAQVKYVGAVFPPPTRLHGVLLN
jgi:hypothetical protein